MFTSENLKIQSIFKFFRREFASKANSAFTLVEALVAISILMIAIASPMTLAQKGLSTATQSKDQMIAAFLAQGMDALDAKVPFKSFNKAGRQSRASYKVFSQVKFFFRWIFL